MVGLGDMVRKTGYVERQLRRWRAQVHATGAPELALLDEVHDLLASRIPAQSGRIVHGDYRAGNVAFGPDGALRAVFDWELATSGDCLCRFSSSLNCSRQICATSVADRALLSKSLLRAHS